MIPKKKELVNLVILSLEYDNAFNEGFLTFREWSNKIKIITDIDKYNVVRILFNELIKSKIFEKKKVKRTVLYLFNPYKREYKEPVCTGIISFD